MSRADHKTSGLHGGMLAALVIWSMATDLACTASRAPGGGSSRAPSVPGLPSPIFRLMPERNTYFFVARRAGDLSAWARGFVEPLRVLEPHLNAGELDQALRRSLGASPLDLADLEEAGIDIDGAAAVFSSRIFPTLALRVRDEALLTAFLERRTRFITTFIQPYRGRSVTSWRGTALSGSLVRVGAYLFIHLRREVPGAPPRGERKAMDHRWIDEILAAAEQGQSLASSPLLRRIARRVGPGRRAWGWADLPALGRALRAIERARTPAGRRPICADEPSKSSLLGQLILGLELKARAGDARIFLELSPQGLRWLRPRVTSGLGLPARIAREAPARLLWRLSPSLIGELLGQLGEGACGALRGAFDRLRAELGWGKGDPRVLAGTPLEGLLARGGAAALLASEEKGKQTLHLRGALIGRCPARVGCSALKGRLPLAAGQPEGSASTPVYSLDLKRPMGERARFSDAGGLYRFSAGEGIMPQLLGELPADQPWLFKLSLRPAALADLRAGMRLLEEEGPTSPDPFTFRIKRRTQHSRLDRWANLLSSYRVIEAGLRLEGLWLELNLEYQLR